jgi:hypothetical protein|tara:strand:+ start:647 stop:988 length:342 start_codon:yes stop_codon:yes gene_type:complete
MTKEQIALRAQNYRKRINALNSSIYRICGITQEDELKTLHIMLAEYTQKLESLSVTKEYMVDFEGGGWNTIYATNDEDALKNAKAEHDGEHTIVSSVRLSTPDGMEAAMRSFY